MLNDNPQKIVREGNKLIDHFITTLYALEETEPAWTYRWGDWLAADCDILNYNDLKLIH